MTIKNVTDKLASNLKKRKNMIEVKGKKSSKAYLDFIVPIKLTTTMGRGGLQNNLQNK